MQIEINFEYIRLTRLLETRGDVRVRQAARRVVERPLRGLHRVHGAEDDFIHVTRRTASLSLH